MWTTENRELYDRIKLRYPSNLAGNGYTLIKPLSPSAKRGGHKRTVDVREIVSGLVCFLSTDYQCSALLSDLPPRSAVNPYFMR